MTNLISIILTSGIVSVILTYITNIKDNKLLYITQERKEWRNEIRNIAEEIYMADQNNIGRVLTKLKVRINAYGMLDNIRIDKDYHIWKTISRLEKNSDDKEFFANKSQLVNYLALLLKYDWERAKFEVKGNYLITLEAISLFGISIIYAIFGYYYYNSKLGVFLIGNFMGVLFLIILFYRNIYVYKKIDVLKKKNGKLELVLFIFKILLLLILIVLHISSGLYFNKDRTTIILAQILTNLVFVWSITLLIRWRQIEHSIIQYLDCIIHIDKN